MKEGKVLKVLKRSFLVLLTAFLIFAFSGTGAKAASKTPGLNFKDSSMWLQTGKTSTLYGIANIKKGDKLVNIKSSNKKVATAEAAEDNRTGLPSLRVVPVKAGNAKVTLGIKRGGKTYTSSMVVHVVKYKNPLKSFKVGGKEYAEKLNNYPYTNGELTGKSKVTAVAKGDWKVTGIFTYDYRTGKGKSYKLGKAINLDKATQVSVMIQNKKNKKIQLSVHVLANKSAG